MNKAFIFDMDGVIVDSERAWVKFESDFLNKLLGKELSQQVGETIGVTVNVVYDRVKALGFRMSREDFQKAYNKAAFHVYDKATISLGIEELASFLISNNFKLGLLSSSARSWIGKVLPRLTFRSSFESVISLNERLYLKPKPSPDGYIETMNNLGSSPKSTIILEDSNTGIKAAKASGAFTIAFSGNLVPGYKQAEADSHANTMQEVIGIIKSRILI